MRFKEGDKVRVKKFKERPIGWETEGKMDHLMGKVVEIKSSTPWGGYNVYDQKHHCEWNFAEDDLEPVNETIVIYRKDREVIAVDKTTGDKAIAKCSTEDTFDFNVGAKLAFNRLMNGNKENITVEDMRKRLDSYCISKSSCSDCELKFPTCSCGCGVHFVSKEDDGNYEMSDEEIKDAYNIVFGTGIKEVKPKETHKFKVGDIVKGNSKSDKKYNITNSNMTMGKVTRVSNDGDTITIEVLEHKNMKFEAGTECGVESKYFDLVEEATKLYNGKIIFTKGDRTFKNGHIYEVKDGRIRTKYGQVPMKEPFKDIEDVKDYFTGDWDGNRKRKIGWSAYTLELIEVKED